MFSNPLVSRTTKHSGAIKALQFNPFKSELLATAGAKGEVYVPDYPLRNKLLTQHSSLSGISITQRTLSSSETELLGPMILIAWIGTRRFPIFSLLEEAEDFLLYGM